MDLNSTAVPKIGTQAWKWRGRRTCRGWAWRAALLTVLLATGCAISNDPNTTPVLSTFESTPVGANVFVDGWFVGRTPATFHLPAKDRVEVRVDAPGYMFQEMELKRRRGVPQDAEPGVGWEKLYYFELEARQN